MELITSNKYDQFSAKNTCLAVGAFDGLHQGHQQIIKEAVQAARKNNYPAGVLSFKPHPLAVIPGENPPPAIISRKQKISLLADLGLDYYFEQEFNQQFAELRPVEFIKKILLNKIKVNTVVVGDDFRFAYKNEGNAQLLKEMAGLYNFKTRIISQLEAGNQRISSTRIRSLLKKGKLNKAAELLGRPFQLCGKVIHGKKRGRKLGFPTANLDLECSYALPPRGVYAVEILIGTEKYIGAANLGYNPTFNNQDISFEIYIIDFAGDLYDQRICVDIIEFIRGEKDFAKKEELIKQMEQDILYTRNLLC